MEPILNIAQNAARKAGGIILLALERIEHIKVFEKSRNDFVTETDQQVENELIYHIRKAYPTHGIIAEESGEQIQEEDEYRWIIDPIDGTANFMHGLPHFAISIAVEHKGRIEHGLIFDPIRQETFTASKGRGAFLNNHRMRVRPTLKLDEALLTTGLPFHRPDLLEKYMKGFTRLSQLVSDIRRLGSASLDLAYVAAGRVDGYWEYDLKKWDIAAGALLVKEAGGYVTDFAGTDAYLENGNILAATPKIYPHLFNAIK